MTLSPNAKQIIDKRYIYHDKEETTWEDVAIRVGTGVGGQEYGELFSELLTDMKFIAGGRILRNVGRPRGSLFNCYCLPIGDSREEIGTFFKNALILWGEGGGVGCNFSTLRPKGAPIKGVGGASSGLVSFMRAADGIAATIESGGQRRAAALGLCEVWHPEIRNFIKAKKEDGEISYHNISVGVNESFIDAVRCDQEYELRFNYQSYATVDSKLLWTDIISAMSQNGEPGLINMSNLRENNSYYFAPIVGVNPCGEAVLEAYGVCCLGSLVLPKFISDTGRVNWTELSRTIHTAVRFLDYCIDLNRFVLPENKAAAARSRRIGIGTMGLADMLFKAKLRYGSSKAIDFVERLFKFIRNESYTASMKLAQEKGAFPAFDSKLYCKAKFVKSLPVSLRKDIRKYGTRNVTTMAIAPTGTISLLPECTPSIEPLMYKAYKRKDRVSERLYVHSIYRDIIVNGDSVPDWYVDSTDLNPKHHVEMQAAIQRYTDGAVSKTILIPNDFNDDDLGDLILESLDDLKGVTVYREGSREHQVINPYLDITKDEIVDSEASEEVDISVCASGKCDL